MLRLHVAISCCNHMSIFQLDFPFLLLSMYFSKLEFCSNMKVDMVADMKVDMVADMKVDMVADIEVYKVADIKMEMVVT